MKKIVNFFSRLCEDYLPDAFVFCLVLTLVVFLSALALTEHSFLELTAFWGNDFWNLHTFAMQMVFVLVTGHMLATSPLIEKLLEKLAGKIHSEKMALIGLSLFSTIACWINWGFGLIVSGVLAIELARHLKKVNFGLFVATAYSGFLVWHGGLSGSIPLKIAGHDEILTKTFPGLTIPLSETIFSGWNLLLSGILLVALPLIMLSMRSSDGEALSLPPREKKEKVVVQKTFRSFLENTPWLNLIFFILFLCFFFGKNSPLDINRVNLIFLFLVILLHGTPANFLKALGHSVSHSSGIIIQFPFYAGIMGLMQHSGLLDIVSAFFVSISTAKTLPLWTFLSGGIVNFFVPSGGGQWVIQGPIMLKAARDMGLGPEKVSMALAWGDAWTNMIQPFWALPLLGMAGIKLKDIMGYCLVVLFLSGIIISSVLLLS